MLALARTPQAREADRRTAEKEVNECIFVIIYYIILIAGGNCLYIRMKRASLYTESSD